MTKLLLLCLTFAVALPHLGAQPHELFGGVTVARMKPDLDSNQATLNGWNSSFTTYLHPRFGLTADVAGFYGNAHPEPSLAPVSIRQHSILGGPQFRLFRTARVETSVRALFGLAHGSVENTTYNNANRNSFAALIGSNFDVNLSRHVALRFSPGMYLTQYGSGTERNFRISVGPVFRFGGREE